jgi:hypothetical protein
VKLDDDLKAFLDQLPVVAAVVDSSAHARWLNRHARHLTAVDDPVGAAAEELFRPEGRTVMEVLEETQKAGGPTRNIRAATTPTGQYLVGETTHFPLEDGGMLTIAVDVTAALRLAAHRVLTGAQTGKHRPPAAPEEFLRLVLGGAEVPALCAALDADSDTIYSMLARLIG